MQQNVHSTTTTSIMSEEEISRPFPSSSATAVAAHADDVSATSSWSTTTDGAYSIMSTSWTCVVCQYKNIDPKFGTCAMCGSKDANVDQLEDHRYRLRMKHGVCSHGILQQQRCQQQQQQQQQQQRKQAGTTKSIDISSSSSSASASWITNVESTMTATVAAPKTKSEVVTTICGCDEGRYGDKVNVAATSSSLSSPSRSLSRPGVPRSSPSTPSPKSKSKTNTKRNDKVKSQQSALKDVKEDHQITSVSPNNSAALFIFRPQMKRNSRNDFATSVLPPSLSLNRKPRHDSFDEVVPLAPNERPPKSPIAPINKKNMGDSTSAVTSATTSTTSFNLAPSNSHRRLSRTPTLVGSDDQSEESSIPYDSVSVTSSTVAVRGGLVNSDLRMVNANDNDGHDKHFDDDNTSRSSTDVTLRTAPTLLADGDAMSVPDLSEAGISISSHSTVKHSNTTTPAVCTRNVSRIAQEKRKNLFTRRPSKGRTTAVDRNDSSSEQNSDDPMMIQSFSSDDDSEDRRASLCTKTCQFSSVVQYPIQEEHEVTSPQIPPYCSTPLTSLRSTSDGIDTDPPHIHTSRLQCGHEFDERNYSEVMPCSLSGVVPTAATYGGDYETIQNRNTTSNDSPNDRAIPSNVNNVNNVDDDEGRELFEETSTMNVDKKYGTCLVWSVVVGVIFLSVVIALFVLAFGDSKNGSSGLSTIDSLTEPPST